MTEQRRSVIKRKAQSLILAVGCLVFLDRILPQVLSYGIHCLMKYGIFMRQFYWLYTQGIFSAVLAMIEDIGTLICMALAVWIFRKTYFNMHRQSASIENKIDIGKIFLSAVLGFGTAEFAVFCITLLPPNIQEAYMGSMGISNEIYGLFLLTFLAAHIFLTPVTEEVIFRGVLYRLFRNDWGSIQSILLISVFFASIHDRAVQIGYSFCIGVILCAIREKYGSILYTVVFHIIFNFFGSGLFFMNQAEQLMYAGCIIFMIAVVLFMIDMGKRLYYRRGTAGRSDRNDGTE